MRRFHLLVFAIFVLSIAPNSHAQTAAYLLFSAGNPQNWIYGGTAGVYHDPWHLFSTEAGVDVRGSFLGNGQTPDTPQIYGVTAGPRLAFHPHVLPIKPYIEVLAGGGHVRSGSANTGRFEYQIVGGIDLKIISRLDWRFFDYAYTGYPGLNVGYRGYAGYAGDDDSFSPKLLSTGLVLRLP
jgi:hypothetical protein